MNAGQRKAGGGIQSAFFWVSESVWQRPAPQHHILHTHTISHCLPRWAEAEPEFTIYGVSQHKTLLLITADTLDECSNVWTLIIIEWTWNTSITLNITHEYPCICMHTNPAVSASTSSCCNSSPYDFLWGSSSSPHPRSYLHSGHASLCYPI